MYIYIYIRRSLATPALDLPVAGWWLLSPCGPWVYHGATQYVHSRCYHLCHAKHCSYPCAIANRTRHTPNPETVHPKTLTPETLRALRPRLSGASSSSWGRILPVTFVGGILLRSDEKRNMRCKTNSIEHSLQCVRCRWACTVETFHWKFSWFGVDFWVDFGSVLGFGVDFRLIWDRFGVDVGSISGRFWVGLGINLSNMKWTVG